MESGSLSEIKMVTTTRRRTCKRRHPTISRECTLSSYLSSMPDSASSASLGIFLLLPGGWRGQDCKESISEVSLSIALIILVIW